MNQSNSTSNEEGELCPPPYTPSYSEQNSYTGMTYQVGKGNIAVVSPSGAYGNMVHPDGPVGGNQQHGPAPPPYFNASEDDSFSSATIRKGFIRKVYLTLLIQLLCTFGIICAFLYWNTLKIWVSENYWFPYSMMPVVLVLILVLSGCDNISRRVPLNFIALSLFTIAKGLMLGSGAVYFQADAVMWAVGATALVSFGISLFAMQSKWDFTPGAGYLCALCWSFISFALLCAIIRSQYLYIFYAFLGTVLFSLYLVFDTQLILGGKHRKYEICPEEYVFAALKLYLDIVTLFVFLLHFINLCR